MKFVCNACLSPLVADGSFVSRDDDAKSRRCANCSRWERWVKLPEPVERLMFLPRVFEYWSKGGTSAFVQSRCSGSWWDWPFRLSSVAMLGVAMWFGPGSWELIAFKVVAIVFLLLSVRSWYVTRTSTLDACISKLSDAPQRLRDAFIAKYKRRALWTSRSVVELIGGLIVVGPLAWWVEYFADALLILIVAGALVLEYTVWGPKKALYGRLPELLHADMLTLEGMTDAYLRYSVMFESKWRRQRSRGLKFEDEFRCMKCLLRLNVMFYKRAAKLEPWLNDLMLNRKMAVPSVRPDLEQITAEKELLAEAHTIFNNL